MTTNYWGYVQVVPDGWMQRINATGRVVEEINPAFLPDWIKVKMAMLDLMSGKTALPCGSYKIVYSRSSAAWFIYEDVSSTRERSEGA